MAATEEKPVTAVEDVKDAEDVSDSSDDEAPALEEAGAAGAAGEKHQSKGEKKARKALEKLNLKQVEGINRVTLIKQKSLLLVVSRPDVYKSSADTYVIVGETQMEDLSAQAQAQAQAADQVRATPAAKPEPAAAVTEEGEVDETGLEPKDIELVMSQANVSRAKAVAALKKNSDIVTAIMELSV